MVTDSKEAPPIEHIDASGDDTTNDSHATASGQVVSETYAPVHDKSESVKWVIDSNFRKELIRLGISEDPVEWLVILLFFGVFFFNFNNFRTVAQVRHWLQWAVRQFSLVSFV